MKIETHTKREIGCRWIQQIQPCFRYCARCNAMMTANWQTHCILSTRYKLRCAKKNAMDTAIAFQFLSAFRHREAEFFMCDVYITTPTMSSNEIIPNQTRHAVAVPSGQQQLVLPRRSLVWGSLFANNAWVYYQPHSLSTGSGGSGVRNCRHKARKTW